MYSWESFFSCQRSPVLRSQLLASLMAGTTLTVERLPNAMLLDVLLIATATRELFDAEIVDDYEGLLTRTRDTWDRPDWTIRTFDSIHGMWASRIAYAATRNFDSYEERYIPAMVQWYLAQSAPNYFKKELKK